MYTYTKTCYFLFVSIITWYIRLYAQFTYIFSISVFKFTMQQLIRLSFIHFMEDTTEVMQL